MADADTMPFTTYREAMSAYATDTARHFLPGAMLEPRYLTIASFVVPMTRVLDVGCNSGAMGVRLAHERNCEMYGVEPSPHFADIALSTGRYKFVWPGLMEDVADNIPDNWFDVVLSCDPLDYCIDPIALLLTMRRKVRRGGWIVGDGVHRAGWWGDTASHPELMRSWTGESALEFLCKYLTMVDVTEVAARVEPARPQWVVWRGRRSE